MKPPVPDWTTHETNKLNDGKYNLPPLFKDGKFSSRGMFPGYIENKNYPFTFCNALMESNKWCTGDEKDRYLKNLATAPLNWKYRTKEVEYIVNSNGYRCSLEWDAIDWKNAIVLFGCSNTFGVGLAEDETIAYYLEQLTGRQVVNLGFPGGSNNLIANNAAALIKNFGIPYGVVINWSTTDRFRFYNRKGCHEVGPWTNNNTRFFRRSHANLSVLYEQMFVDPVNQSALSYYWSTYTDAMFEGRTRYCKVSYFDDAAHYTRSDKFFHISNSARDRFHPGADNSKAVAEFVAEKFNKGI